MSVIKNGSNRRQFLFKCGVTGVAAMGAQSVAFSADLPPLSPNDPMAAALGYVEDATTTDVAKFSRYKTGQECANCQLYLGEGDSEVGGCPLFAGKTVAAKGWCASWVLKAS